MKLYKLFYGNSKVPNRKTEKDFKTHSMYTYLAIHVIKLKRIFVPKRSEMKIFFPKTKSIVEN